MKRELFPPELREFYFDFDWDNRKVWSLDVPVETIPMAEVEWHLGMPIWTSVHGEPRFDLVPKHVLGHLDTYPRHREKMEKCDETIPIDMMWSEDRFVILDGIHRLAKLKMQGATQVKVRKIPREMIPQIEKETQNPHKRD